MSKAGLAIGLTVLVGSIVGWGQAQTSAQLAQSSSGGLAERSADAAPQPHEAMALSQDALALSALLHAVVPELRDSSAQLQLVQAGAEWRFRIATSTLDGRRNAAHSDGLATMSKGRLRRLSMRQEPGAARPITPLAAGEHSSATPVAVPPPGSAPASRANRGAAGGRPAALTAQDALDFVLPGLRRVLGPFDPQSAVFGTGRSAAAAWRFDVHVDDAPGATCTLEFDPETGRLVSVEVR